MVVFLTQHGLLASEQLNLGMINSGMGLILMTP